MKSLITALGLVSPVLLFLFKYILPARFNVVTRKKFEIKQILSEFIHFPSELLMVAIGYTIPKAIEYLIIVQSDKEQAQTLSIGILINFVFALVVFLVIPFMVAETKIIENEWFAGKKRKAKWKIFITYVIAIVAITVSLLLGV